MLAPQPTNRQVRQKYGGRMGDLYADEVKLKRGQAAIDSVAYGDKPFGLYAQVKQGSWLHRNLQLEKRTPSDVLSDAVLDYIQNGRVKHNLSRSTLQHSAAVPVQDRRCILSVKENGVHIMLTLERLPDGSRRIKDICGKQGPFDNVNARTGAFKAVAYALLHNAKFDFLPDDAEYVLLQAELVVPRTFMRKTNHSDVASLVFKYEQAQSDEDKYEILNKLELRFFNVGGLEIDSMDQSTTYRRYSLDKVCGILMELAKEQHEPRYAKGTKRKLCVCDFRYFDADVIQNDWEASVADIVGFATEYRDREGFIMRPEGCQWIKFKAVYTDRLGAATRVPGCVVPVLIGPSGQLDTVHGVIIAPPLDHGGSVCKELLTIDFGIKHDPDGETRAYYQTGGKWDALDYLRDVLARGEIAQHSRTVHDWKCTYRVARQGGDHLTFHFRNLEKLGHRVAFVDISRISQVEPCFCFKFNELIASEHDVRLDTPVLMGLTVSGGRNGELESKTLDQLVDIMTPPEDDHIYRGLTTQAKVFLRARIPGSLQKSTGGARDLPWDFSKHDAFLSGIASSYDDFLRGNVTDVHLAKRYLLAAKHRREGLPSPARPFAGYQFPHGKCQAPRITYQRRGQTEQASPKAILTEQASARPILTEQASARPIETPPPSARSTQEPVSFTIVKTPDSCGVHNNTAYDKLESLKTLGRHYRIGDATPEQYAKLLGHTLERVTNTKKRANWELGIRLLRRPHSLQSGEKAMLSRLVKDLTLILPTPEEAKTVLFDEDGRERDSVVECVRIPIEENEWVEIARSAEPEPAYTQIDRSAEPEPASVQIDLTEETRQCPEQPAKRRRPLREPASLPSAFPGRTPVSARALLAAFMDEDEDSREDLHIGGGTPHGCRYTR